MKEIKRYKEGDKIPCEAKFLQGALQGEERIFFYEVNIKQDSKKQKDSQANVWRTCQEAIAHLNKVTGKRFSPKSDETIKMIKGRMASGYTLEDFISVIDNMSRSWLDDPKFSQYLRPSTLFRASNFENYLNFKSAQTELLDAFDELEQAISGS